MECCFLFCGLMGFFGAENAFGHYYLVVENGNAVKIDLKMDFTINFQFKKKIIN